MSSDPCLTALVAGPQPSDPRVDEFRAHPGLPGFRIMMQAEAAFDAAILPVTQRVEKHDRQYRP